MKVKVQKLFRCKYFMILIRLFCSLILVLGISGCATHEKNKWERVTPRPVLSEHEMDELRQDASRGDREAQLKLEWLSGFDGE